MASSGAPCSMAAFRVASGWEDPRGFGTKRFLLRESSSQESNFQNWGGALHWGKISNSFKTLFDKLCKVVYHIHHHHFPIA